ncbi:hypothetical protein [Streptomyces tubercidicus]|uniref:hypothetical protein n=1 Tax=Streptomyces tubercidicus TaxID=47759 RepID=UPI002E16EE1A
MQVEEGEDRLIGEEGPTEYCGQPLFGIGLTALCEGLRDVGAEQRVERLRRAELEGGGKSHLQRRGIGLCEPNEMEVGHSGRVESVRVHLLDQLLGSSGPAVQQLADLRGVRKERHPRAHDHSGLGGEYRGQICEESQEAGGAGLVHALVNRVQDAQGRTGPDEVEEQVVRTGAVRRHARGQQACRVFGEGLAPRLETEVEIEAEPPCTGVCGQCSEQRALAAAGTTGDQNVCLATGKAAEEGGRVLGGLDERFSCAGIG